MTLLWFALLIVSAGWSSAHNILVVLLDDVDALPQTLETGLPNVTDYFTQHGVIFDNAFVTTPICCPSRASILTGTYQHNHRTLDNTVKNGCDGPNWDRNIAPNSMGARLQKLGYRTAMYGKYSNNYKGTKTPEGWDDWLGLVGNSVYYNYTLRRNNETEKHGNDPAKDYLPNLLLDATLSFISSNSTKPWFTYLSFPTAHEPFDAEPQYQGMFKDMHPPSEKFPTFNKTGEKDKHWYTRSRPPLTSISSKYNTMGWRRRIQSLQTVDRGIMKILNLIDKNNTSVIFTSDNGFYFGEWGMILDKRQPYEITVRVPMFAAGPAFPKKSSQDKVVLNIDIAPTVVDLATKASRTSEQGETLERHVEFDGVSMLSDAVRTSFLIEYNGMGNFEDTNECSHANMRCWYKDHTVWATEPKFDIPAGQKFCFCVDSTNNTFHCERRLESATYWNKGQFNNYLHCYFPLTGFTEFYDLNHDPFQMSNTWDNLTMEFRDKLQIRVEKFTHCRGAKQCNFEQF